MLIGIDITDLNRIARIAEKKSLNKYFSEKEIDLAESFNSPTRKIEILAGRWAIKEAVVKAIGTGFTNDFNFRHIETIKGENGQPILQLKENVNRILCSMNVKNSCISITHNNNYAIGVCVFY